MAHPFYPLDKPGMELITTTEELATICERLARHPFVTIDTEFLRETTYYPLLCVAQLASSDEAVVIDALAPGIDLKPFFELMANEKVLKVFHAARQDIEIVWHRANIVPHPIFDTQVAASSSVVVIKSMRGLHSGLKMAAPRLISPGFTGRAPAACEEKARAWGRARRELR